MAKILFLVDYEHGHVLSTMALSKTLAARGHEILYVGLADARETVVGQGFAFRPIMEDLFPAGSVSKVRQRRSPDQNPVRARDSGSLFDRHPAFGRAKGACFARCVSGQLVGDIVRELQPHVAVALSYYYLEGLVIHLRYGLPVLFFTPHLRTESRPEAAASVMDGLMNSSLGLPEFLRLLRGAGVTIRSMNDLVDLLLKLPEFIALPRSFEDPAICQDPLVYYIGAGVDLHRREPNRTWRSVANGRPLIYCSLGSQCALKVQESVRCFKNVLRAFEARQNWFLVLSTGNAVSAGSLDAVPPNACVLDWAAQMDLLGCASLMITHGGIGTVKECILSGVPMVVLPLMRDQFDCAERVARLGLGLSHSMDSATAESVQAMVGQALASEEIRRNVNRMAEAFHREDRLSTAADIVEQWAGRRGGSPAPHLAEAC